MNNPASPPDAQPTHKADSLSIALVGDRGRMGAMLSKRLAGKGFSVTGTDSARHPNDSGNGARLAAATAGARVVMICVPVGALENLLATLGPLLQPSQILMDITSVKSIPMSLMQQAFDGPVIGSHPLFGPNPLDEDMRTILVRGEKATADDCLVAEHIFTSIHSKIHWATAEEHDRGVAIAQTLNFTVSAAFFCTLAEDSTIRPFLTPSFKRHLEAARKHLTEDTAMFLEFSARNPFFKTALEAYTATLERVKKGELSQVAKEAQQWYASIGQEGNGPAPGQPPPEEMAP